MTQVHVTTVTPLSFKPLLVSVVVLQNSYCQAAHVYHFKIAPSQPPTTEETTHVCLVKLTAHNAPPFLADASKQLILLFLLMKCWVRYIVQPILSLKTISVSLSFSVLQVSSTTVQTFVYLAARIVIFA